MQGRTRLAVVVVFQERTAYSDECIAGLRALEGGPHRIVLVPDRRIPEYDEVGVQVPFEGTVAAKRNAGVGACGDVELVAFIDSDAYPEPAWARRAIEAFDALPDDVAILTGPNLTPTTDPPGRQFGGHALASPLIMADGALFWGGGGARREVQKAYTCNLFVRREALEGSGGFDERLLNNEDLAFCEVVRRNGGRIFYDPDVIVRHHRRGLLHFWIQWFNEGLAVRDYLGFTHAGWWLPFLPSVLVVLKIAVLILVGRRPWLALQVAQWAVFFVERRLRTGRTVVAAGAAVAMWGFLKAFGIGGLLAWLPLSRSRVVPSRHDPVVAAGRGGGPVDEGPGGR
jgi:hypothetical protein